MVADVAVQSLQLQVADPRSGPLARDSLIQMTALAAEVVAGPSVRCSLAWKVAWLAAADLRYDDALAVASALGFQAAWCLHKKSVAAAASLLALAGASRAVLGMHVVMALMAQSTHLGDIDRTCAGSCPLTAPASLAAAASLAAFPAETALESS